MIVREIEDQPEILNCFDWFNDYEDTKRWAVRNGHTELVKKLEEGNDAYWKSRYKSKK